jgi:hypothetical protein
MNTKLTKDEKLGIKMIQTLQGVVNIDESDEKALRGWRGMSESEKETTRVVYKMFSKEK